MEFIRDIHARARSEGRPAFSFEFFPPKTDEGDRNLFERTLPALLRLKPDYCSVTYGAGGSTRDKTLGIVERIQNEHHLTAMAHLTCVNSTREMLGAVVEDARRRGIRNLLALRGDPPTGTSEWTKVAGGFEYSWELVKFLKELGGFCLGVAGFPEGHIACREGKLVDWERLKHKVDQGAEFVITQLFFDNADFFAFWDHLRNRLGSHVTVIPGILPILSGSQVKKFTTLCGARIPDRMMKRLGELGEDDEAVIAYGIEYAAAQCRELIDRGAPGLHFYCLNKSRSTCEVVERLGLQRPNP
ncbi:MAG: methylenetetrahydrofolate reductase [NAD(P)H] [Verrucomicrobiales bacterium]|nr:methylenetetrahydrofolate reductase [NAD(P)H] [Verrucomicrobiales bacterium]